MRLSLTSPLTIGSVSRSSGLLQLIGIRESKPHKSCPLFWRWGAAPYALFSKTINLSTGHEKRCEMQNQKGEFPSQLSPAFNLLKLVCSSSEVCSWIPLGSYSRLRSVSVKSSFRLREKRLCNKL